jgi:hypothetical protein
MRSELLPATNPKRNIRQIPLFAFGYNALWLRGAKL